VSNTWEQWEGQVVNGTFRLEKYLGGGECSAVFLTEVALREPQKAAIKLIWTDSENADVQLSYWDLAIKLSHPHLMQLFGMGRCQLGDAKLLYVLMEYAEESLSQALAERPITPEEAREMLEPALDALAYVHGKGFVHGHLKPTNIMAVDDQLKISSDGIRRVGEPDVIRRKLAVYDAPEFAKGKFLPAGDVWSVGMTVVEALTQRAPVWERSGRKEPVVPRTLPAPFRDLARHCLARDPQRRYTVAAIAAALRQTAAPPKKFTTRRYMVPAAALGLLLAGILVGPRLLQRSPGAQPAPAAVEQPAIPSRPEPKAVAPEAAPSSIVPAPPRSETKAEPPASGRAPGEVLHRVLPDVPRKARETIQGKVRVSVRVRVDASGNVAGATLETPGPSRYFAGLALQAARRWKFVPAKADDREIASGWLLRFEFGRTGTKVFPVRSVKR
jgi:TonB family protein